MRQELLLICGLKTKKAKFSIPNSKRLDKPFTGYWHVPGTFLLLGETVEECLSRVAKEEIGLIINIKEPKLLWLDQELEEPRGHVVHLVYLIKVSNGDVKESKTQKFFFKPPEQLIPSHRHIFLNI